MSNRKNASFKLSKSQYKFLASFAKTLAEAIIIGFSAAMFLPEVFQLNKAVSVTRFTLFLSVGLISLVSGVILEKKGEHT